MTTKPRIATSTEAKDKGAVKKVKSLLKAAVRRLDNACAWPIEKRGYAIIVVPGQAVNIKYRRSKALDWDTRPFDLKDLHIAVGEHLLSSKMFKFYKDAGLGELDIASFLLAHEVFHLTEIQRQNDCRFPAKLAGSGFASSVRSEMTPEWTAMVKDLAIKFSPLYRVAHTIHHNVPSEEVIRANDAVSETCADLMALEIVAPFVTDIQTLRAAAVAFRVADQAAGGGTYQCAASITALEPQCAGQAPGQIVVATWHWALVEIIKAPDVPADFKQRAQALTLLLKPAMAPIPEPRGPVAKAIRWFMP